MDSNRWFILSVLFVARFSLGFQFQSAGSVTPFVVEDFAIDYARVGTLVGLFMIPGLVLAVPSGFIGKRFGDKPMVLIGLAPLPFASNRLRLLKYGATVQECTTLPFMSMSRTSSGG